MAIDISLLIAAPVLQDYLVDKDGTPMSSGTITCYQDNSRTTLKNWYYQSGTPGNYTYVTLPNPLTLSAAGTICDVNGNDTIPFFYPYSETDNLTVQTYYITIENYDQTNQITRQNFPFLSSENTPALVEPTYSNYIVNNRFWRNIGSLNAATLSIDPYSGLYSATLAPSQHDGFSMPDIKYIKSVNGATETITFTKFPLTEEPILVNDITPEFYINHDCTESQSGETYKYYQFPISLHVNTLASVEASVTIQAQNVSGNVNNFLTLAIYQFTGTGTTSPAVTNIQTVTLNNTWQKYTYQFVFPETDGLTLGNGGDDALYLQVGMPLSVTCDINFTLPSIYLSTAVPTNDFATYDQIDSIINSPRTGDIRTSLNSFYYYGWLPMNNGTVGNASSNATTRANADTWQLFSLIWKLGKVYSNGTSNGISIMFNSTGSAVTYGSSAITDFNANNSLSLTSMMGHILIGSVPPAVMSTFYSTTITASNSGGSLLITTGNSVGYFNGMPIAFTNTGGSLPGGISANNIYYVANFNGSNTFNLATSFANAVMPVGNIESYSSAGSGTNTCYFAPTGTIEGEYQQSTSGSGTIATGASIVSTGTRSELNVTQPGTFYNMFIKM